MRRNIASEEQNAKNIISQPAFLFFLLLLISLCSQLRAGNFDLTHIIIHDTCTYQLKSFVKFKFRKFLSCTAAFLGILRIIAQDREAAAASSKHKLKMLLSKFLATTKELKLGNCVFLGIGKKSQLFATFFAPLHPNVIWEDGCFVEDIIDLRF